MSVESMLAVMAQDWKVEILAEAKGGSTFWRVTILSLKKGDQYSYVRMSLAAAVTAAYCG